MEVTKNVFQSLSMDLDASLVKNTDVLFSQNFRVLVKENNNWIRTNVKGNALASQLPENYVPVAIETYSGIAYIISAEVINGTPTGRGEIGTFPSPNYGFNKEMHPRYYPLQNYMGDNDMNIIGPMRSANFRFTLKKAFSMVLEKDYDNTVNIIFTDGVNPMRIVNSRFSLADDFTYETIDRVGEKDTNVYRTADFDTVINLVSQVSRIMKVQFQGVFSGGTMLQGNYRYYFKLETEDGNLSDVMGESGLVSVFHGNTPGSVHGGSDRPETDKSVTFLLDNLDTSYRYLRVFFVYSTGRDEPAEKAFMIDQRFTVERQSMRLTHLGSEQLIPMDLSSLNLESHAIETVGTIAKAGGYLLAADITDKVIDNKALIDFARKITLRHADRRMHTYGKADNGGDLSTVNEQGAYVPGTDAYNNAYANPKNIHDRLGYHSGESYPFGVRFLLPGGAMTGTFPVMGMDNLRGNGIYPSGDLSSLIETLETQHQSFNAGDGKNLKGVYRFPNREAVFDGEFLLVYGIKFKIPEIPKAVRDITVGIQFMRGESNPDRITQGVFFNTMPVPADQYTEARTGRNARGWRLYDYDRLVPAGYTMETAKWIPSFDYNLESFGYWETNNGLERTNKTIGNGIIPIKFNLNGGRGLNRFKMFAFISPEIQSIPAKTISRLHNRPIVMKVKNRLVHYPDAPSKAYGNNRTYSLLRQTTSIPTPEEHKARATWVMAGDYGPNNNRFAGGAYFQAHTSLTDVKRDGPYALFNLKYNSYVGLYLDQGEVILGEPSQAPRAGVENYNRNGLHLSASRLTDIYPESGQRTTAQLKNIYSNLNGISYYPISPRYYWGGDQSASYSDLYLNNNLNSYGEVELFGGDNFIGPHYRRLYINGFGTYGQSNFMEFEGAAALGETLMYFAESRVNSAVRGEHTYDVSEYRDRSFYPYEAGKKTFSEGDNYGNGNPWREYRLPETEDYDHGHRQLLFGRFGIAFPVDSPYIATRRRARIMHSRKFTAGSFNNEFRIWEGLNYQDYDSALGRIVRLGVLGDRVVIVQEKGTSYIRLEERIAAGGDSAGPVFFESAGVLPPKANPVASMGTIWPESVLFTDIGVYGFDQVSQYIWKYDYQKLVPISKLSIDSYIFKNLTRFKNKGYNPLSSYNVVTIQNTSTEEIHFVFRQPENPVNMVYSEALQEFIDTRSWIPEKGFSLDRSFYTFKNARDIYIHEQEGPRGMFYGQQHKFKISFVVNEKVDLDKVFGLLDIMSNHVYPDRITYRVPGAKTSERIISLGPIYMVNAKFRDSKVVVSVPKVQEITDNDVTEYGLALRSNNKATVVPGARLTGQLMVVDLEYSDPDLITLKSVLTYFNFS